MITLHHMNNSRSFRILWLLNELKQNYAFDFSLINHTRNEHNLAPKSLADIHPMGKAPIVEDDGKVLIESGFIIEYLLKHYDGEYKLHPRDGQQWESYAFWLHFAEASMMPPLVMRLVFSGIVKRSPFLIKSITKRIKGDIEKLWLNKTIHEGLSLLDRSLSDKDYLAEDFSAADIQTYFGVKAYSQSASDFDKEFAHIHQWFLRLEARDAYQITCKQGGALSF